jgi:phosphoribosylformylglycinamidine synthase
VADWRDPACLIHRPPARAKLYRQPSHTFNYDPFAPLDARKIFWPAGVSFRTMRWNSFRGQDPLCMKAKIIITPKKAVLDPQGKSVQNALVHMGYHGVSAVHVGKYIEIDLSPGTDKAAAEQALNEASRKFLSNPIIEDYRLAIE